MHQLDQWLAAYGESHQHPQNVAIHKLCIPLILFSLLGGLQSVPLWINPAWMLVAAGCLFYLRLSWRMALAMLLLCLPMLGLWAWMAALGLPVRLVAVWLFVLAWVGQFIGHQLEGKRPSFFQDLRFLLIGPAWTIATVLRGRGIRW